MNQIHLLIICYFEWFKKLLFSCVQENWLRSVNSNKSKRLSWTSQVTYVTMVPRVGNETLRPLGVATGNASSMTRVWRYICKNTIRWPATAHDVTTGATIIKGSPGEYIISFFVWSLRPKHGPKPRGRSVSFPTRGTMVTYVTWDVPLHGNSNCVP